MNGYFAEARFFQHCGIRGFPSYEVSNGRAVMVHFQKPRYARIGDIVVV